MTVLVPDFKLTWLVSLYYLVRESVGKYCISYVWTRSLKKNLRFWTVFSSSYEQGWSGK